MFVMLDIPGQLPIGTLKSLAFDESPIGHHDFLVAQKAMAAGEIPRIRSAYLFHNNEPVLDTVTADELGLVEDDMISLITSIPGLPEVIMSPDEAIDEHRAYILRDPTLVSDLARAQPELMGAIEDVDEFRRLWRSLESVESGSEISRLMRTQLLNADPFNPLSQSKIAEIIQHERVVENLQHAYENNPEAFTRCTMLYVDAEVNDVPVKVFVDSGAQTTIISLNCAEKCNILNLLDVRYRGTAKGVGTAHILGRIHSASFKIGDAYAECSFTVIEGREVDILLGLDMMKRFQACIDLKKNELVFENTSVPFLPSHQVPEFGNGDNPGACREWSRENIMEQEQLRNLAQGMASADVQSLPPSLVALARRRDNSSTQGSEYQNWPEHDLTIPVMKPGASSTEEPKSQDKGKATKRESDDEDDDENGKQSSSKAGRSHRSTNRSDGPSTEASTSGPSSSSSSSATTREQQEHDRRSAQEAQRRRDQLQMQYQQLTSFQWHHQPIGLTEEQRQRVEVQQQRQREIQRERDNLLEENIRREQESLREQGIYWERPTRHESVQPRSVQQGNQQQAEQQQPPSAQQQGNQQQAEQRQQQQQQQQQQVEQRQQQQAQQQQQQQAQQQALLQAQAQQEELSAEEQQQLIEYHEQYRIFEQQQNQLDIYHQRQVDRLESGRQQARPTQPLQPTQQTQPSQPTQPTQGQTQQTQQVQHTAVRPPQGQQPGQQIQQRQQQQHVQPRQNRGQGGNQHPAESRPQQQQPRQQSQQQQHGQQQQNQLTQAQLNQLARLSPAQLAQLSHLARLHHQQNNRNWRPSRPHRPRFNRHSVQARRARLHRRTRDKQLMKARRGRLDRSRIVKLVQSALSVSGIGDDGDELVGAVETAQAGVLGGIVAPARAVGSALPVETANTEDEYDDDEDYEDDEDDDDDDEDYEDDDDDYEEVEKSGGESAATQPSRAEPTSSVPLAVSTEPSTGPIVSTSPAVSTAPIVSTTPIVSSAPPESTPTVSTPTEPTPTVQPAPDFDPSTVQAVFIPAPDEIQQLVDMGVDRETAELALEQARGDLSMAAMLATE